MGKKKKAKSSFRSSNFSFDDEFSSVEDEVIQHLQLLRESNGLVVGFNAVLRSVAKGDLCVILYVSEKGTSAMYHALNFMKKGKDVLFLQLQDNSGIFGLKIPTSTTYGIKKSVMDQPQFLCLLEKINIAKNSRNNKKGKTVEKLDFENEELYSEKQISHRDITSENQATRTDTTRYNVLEAYKIGAENCVIHSKHNVCKQKYTGKEEMLKFQEVDFPNYKTMFGQISVTIK